MVCLLSGGFDSAVAAYKMMRRGAHVTFVHFWGGGAKPGESSVHVARALVERLVPYQFSAKLYMVPFEPIQREIVRSAPESYRLLLYRRMMLRIAERIARKNHAEAIITGDSLGQVASQTLQNMVAVGAASPMPVFRPLAGDDKQEILAQLNVWELVKRAMDTVTLEKYSYTAGRIERTEAATPAPVNLDPDFVSQSNQQTS
jgi:thiamine biosynthesis protein ThiI